MVLSIKACANTKDGDTQQKKDYTLQLAALLLLFLHSHRECIGGQYDKVVTVPSSGGMPSWALLTDSPSFVTAT